MKLRAPVSLHIKLCQALCQRMKNLPVGGMAWVTLPILKIWDPYNVIRMVKDKYQSSRRLMNALTARYKYS